MKTRKGYVQHKDGTRSCPKCGDPKHDCLAPTPEIKQQHTPTPWEMHQGQDYVHVYGGNFLNDSEHPLADVTHARDAAFIVKAVNAYEELVNALRLIADRDKGQAGIEAREALARAEGK